MPPDLLAFIQAGGITLRGYQESVARAVVDAVLNRRGLSFAVMFPRQSGKNEAQAQIEAYLLWALRDQDADLVKVSPTWRPQAMNAMRRLERVLNRNPFTMNECARESGFILRVGRARITFLSGAQEANIVGATASTLLEVDEAQSVNEEKFDRDILPMAASTNATRVFWGTAWNGKTLLSRGLRAARQAEAARAGQGQAAVRLAYHLGADEVAAEVPAYRVFVDAQVARYGRDHPVVRTQYFCEEVEGAQGMFTAEMVAMMRGSHPPRYEPQPGKIYALLLDVAGEDAAARQLPPGQPALFDLDSADLVNPGRDSTALTVVEVDLTTRGDPLIRAPAYRVVQRLSWKGVLHNALYCEIAAVMRLWNGQRLVVDATGVGAGLASFLSTTFREKVIPFTFTSQSKSDMAWTFLAIVKTGRWKEPAFGEPPAAGRDPHKRQRALQQQFFTEVSHCELTPSKGPELRARWGVPAGARDPQSGARVHDDMVISAALSAALEKVEWAAPSSGMTFIVPGKDPVAEMDGF